MSARAWVLVLVGATLAGCSDAPGIDPSTPPMGSLPTFSFTAVYETGTGTVTVSLGDAVLVADRDLQRREAYPLHIAVEDPALLERSVGGSHAGTVRFQSPLILVYFLDGEFRVGRLDFPCGQNLDPECRYALVDWRPRGALAPFGLAAAAIADQGFAAYSIHGSPQVSTVQATPAEGGLRVSLPETEDLYWLPFLQASEGILLGTEAGPALHLRFQRLLLADHAELTLRSIEHGDELSVIPAWPPEAAPTPDWARRPFMPGLDVDPLGTGQTWQAARDGLRNASPELASHLDSGCLTLFSQYHGGQADISTVVGGVTTNQRTGYTVVVDLDATSEWWSASHRDQGLLGFKYDIDDHEQRPPLGGCRPQQFPARPQAGLQAAYEETLRVPVDGGTTAPYALTFGRALTTAGSLPLYRPYESLTTSYIPAFVNQSAGFTATPYSVSMDLDTFWFQSLVVDPATIHRIDAP